MTYAGSVCVVTGASSGIGRALALALAREGANVWALGRDADRLAAVADEAADGRITSLSADLSDEGALEDAGREIIAGAGRVDVLAHCAGAIARGPVESADVSDLDRLYDVTLRGPFLLTQALLPALKEAAGRIVFVNSLVPRGGANDAVLYTAMKQAAKELADGLRQEVNAHGVRVMTVSPGRTDTPMQRWVHDYEQRDYQPELLLSVDDVVDVVLAALAVGPRGEVTDVSLRPITKLGAPQP
jgi:NAD(P)-dependent dehydrogenase (short-subunit alcohol dehydrogenase family)